MSAGRLAPGSVAATSPRLTRRPRRRVKLFSRPLATCKSPLPVRADKSTTLSRNTLISTRRYFIPAQATVFAGLFYSYQSDLVCKTGVFGAPLQALVRRPNVTFIAIKLPFISKYNLNAADS